MNVGNIVKDTLLVENLWAKKGTSLQDLTVDLNTLPNDGRRDVENRICEKKKFTGINSVEPNQWRLILQDCTKNLQKAEMCSNVVGIIRKAGETSGKMAIGSLFAEKTSCTFPMGDNKELSYFTFYEKDRIYCVKSGDEGSEWEIPLEDESQYDKVMSFLNSLENRDNQSYTIHQTFWKDFLSGDINVDEFKEYWETRGSKGASSYQNISEDGEDVDPQATKFSIYTYGAEFGTVIARSTQEFLEWQQVQCDKMPDEIKEAGGFVAWYYQQHPEEVGKKNQYYMGKWYSMEELFPIIQKDVSALFSNDKEQR